MVAFNPLDQPPPAYAVVDPLHEPDAAPRRVFRARNICSALTGLPGKIIAVAVAIIVYNTQFRSDSRPTEITFHDRCVTSMKRLDSYSSDVDFRTGLDAIVNEPSCNLWGLKYEANTFKNHKRTSDTIKKVQEATEERLDKYLSSTTDILQLCTSPHSGNYYEYWPGNGHPHQSTYNFIAAQINVSPEDIIKSSNQHLKLFIDRQLIRSTKHMLEKNDFHGAFRFANEIMGERFRNEFIDKIDQKQKDHLARMKIQFPDEDARG